MKKSNGLKVLLLLQFCITIIVSAYAKTENITSHQAAGKYYSYPYIYETPPQMTPTPKGYEPFHLEHYGRHGSRWHIGYKFYDQSCEILHKAHSAGKLTPLGERTYKLIKEIKENAHEGRSGELTEVGAIQHRVIAKRMVKNFPEIFVPHANLTARSTVVIRAILSMQNSLDGIRSLCPEIIFSTDASAADMWYLKYDDEEAEAIRKKAASTVLQEYKNNHPNGGDYLSKIVKDHKYAVDSIGDSLFMPLFYALANCQSHSNQSWLLDSIFSPDEINERWLHGNAEWLIQCGNSKLTNNRMPYSQSNLLMNIINSVDTALVSHIPSINLRYGHDSVLLPLAVLMELDNWGNEINDLEELVQNGWRDYLIVPMAANIQMVFYRKPNLISKDDILVKILLNEREVRLPIGNVSGPYYSWPTLRDYYLKKITPYYKFLSKSYLTSRIR